MIVSIPSAGDRAPDHPRRSDQLAGQGNAGQLLASLLQAATQRRVI